MLLVQSALVPAVRFCQSIVWFNHHIEGGEYEMLVVKPAACQIPLALCARTPTSCGTVHIGAGVGVGTGVGVGV